MSRWTHVSGSFLLSAQPYTTIKTKKGRERVIIKYPDRQFVLGQPDVLDEKLEFNVSLYSLPKVEPIFAKATKEIMPQGETHFNYFLNQDFRNHTSSCNNFSFACEKTLFWKKIKERYENDASTLRRWMPKYRPEMFELGWIEECTDFTFTVCDDIRHCSGFRLMDSFEKLFDVLAKNGISFYRGVFEWKDEWEKNLIFSIRQLPTDDKIVFQVFDRSKNKSLAKKTISFDYADNKYVVSESDNWDYLMRGRDE